MNGNCAELGPVNECPGVPWVLDFGNFAVRAALAPAQRKYNLNVWGCGASQVFSLQQGGGRAGHAACVHCRIVRVPFVIECPRERAGVLDVQPGD